MFKQIAQSSSSIADSKRIYGAPIVRTAVRAGARSGTAATRYFGICWATYEHADRVTWYGPSYSTAAPAWVDAKAHDVEIHHGAAHAGVGSLSG